MRPDQFPAAAEQVEKLHAIYCKSTGFDLRLNYDRIHSWWLFIQMGFDHADLVLTLGYLRKEISRERRNPGALKFSNLIRDLDRFEEDLNLAKKTVRRPKPAMVQKVQAVPGGGQRAVEVHRNPDDDLVDVGPIFAKLRAELSELGD